MARTASPTAQRYAAFRFQLLPLSNQQTGFSIRSPRRQPSIEFCYNCPFAEIASETVNLLVSSGNDH